ncbi:putative F-box protein [Capsicum chacoense]
MPNDITIQILLKLSIKLLLRFKCICKSWGSLVENPQFIMLYHDSSKNDVNHQKIFVTDGECDNKDDYFYSVDAPLQHDFVASLIGTPIPGINQSSRVSFTSSSSNGILLLIFPYDLVVLWNPTIRESRKIPSPIPKKKMLERKLFPAIYGFDTSDSYYEVDLFSTRSESWKLIGKFPPNNFFFERDIVNIDENVYIIAMADLSWSMNESTILSVCLEKEQFQQLLFPDQIQRFQDPILYVLGENLCLTRMHDLASRDFEVWHMKKNGLMNNTWSKILTIPSMHCGRCLRLVSLMTSGDIMFLKYKGEFEVYNTKRNKFETIELVGLELLVFFNWVVPHVESLFSPKQKRIQVFKKMIAPVPVRNMNVILKE